jgi:hypothetical protein
MAACHDRHLLSDTSAQLALALASIGFRKPQGNQFDMTAVTVTAAASAPPRTTPSRVSRPKKKIRCTVGLATAKIRVFGRCVLGFGSRTLPKSVPPACRPHSSSLPRHWYWPLRPLPHHRRSPVRRLGLSRLDTASSTRQLLLQQHGRQMGFFLLSTSAPLSLSPTCAPTAPLSTSAPLRLSVVSSMTPGALELGSDPCYQTLRKVSTSSTGFRRAPLLASAKQGKFQPEMILLFVHKC